jgi:hypothetical protein
MKSDCLIISFFFVEKIMDGGELKNEIKYKKYENINEIIMFKRFSV